MSYVAEPSSISLHAGQTYRFRATKLTCLRIRHGSALLQLPFQWLAAQIYTPSCRLGEGDIYRCEQAGWFCLAAEADMAFDMTPIAQRRPGNAILLWVARKMRPE